LNQSCRDGECPTQATEKLYPPCRTACPAHVNVQAYASLISQGRFGEALEVIRRRIPFPSVCGRVCFAPCEDACQRNNVDSPVSIRLLKRVASEAELSLELAAQAEPYPKTRKEKVAVIGAGPAGLTAAFELVKMGYPVTVFERDPNPGGMLRTCLPLYRLPEEVLDADIRYIIDSGVEVKTNVDIGRDLSPGDLWDQGYGALFVAVGAPENLSLNIEGEDLEGVYHALDFLKEAHSEEKPRLEGRVAVIGGGDVAIDSARSAIRLGPDEVTIVYRRQRPEMPAHPKEIDDAEREGVIFEFLASPTRILGEGSVSGLECIRMRLGEPDESGRRRPMPIPGSEFVIPVDFVIEAIGETTDLSFLPEGVSLTRRGAIEADPATCETSMPRLFAGGDVVTGPLSVIDAIAAGIRAAGAIDLFLRGEDLEALRDEGVEEATWVKDETVIGERPKQEEQLLSVKGRRGNFEEVGLGLTSAQGMMEALRCVHCGPCAECLVDEGFCEHDTPEIDEKACSGCGLCEMCCPFEAINVKESESGRVAKLVEASCKGCGLCAAGCPEKAISMTRLSDDFLVEAAVARG